MANLYLIDRPYGENGLNLAQIDPEALVVLVQDGVYFYGQAATWNVPVYAVQADLEVRGLEPLVPANIQRIDYSDLVDLIVEHKVINFA
ncbi:MAG: DsrH/TusB family sulfur relay protein [Anaerolineae bacterium]